jgi:hypothetical protein
MLLHLQERQVSNTASFAGETGFKYCFMCRRDRFQMLLHLQERQVSNTALFAEGTG